MLLNNEAGPSGLQACGVMDTVEAQDMRVTGKYVLNDTYNCARGGSNLFKHIKRNLGQKIQVSKRMQLCTQPFHLGKINSVSPQASLNAHRYMPIPLPTQNQLELPPTSNCGPY